MEERTKPTSEPRALGRRALAFGGLALLVIGVERLLNAYLLHDLTVVEVRVVFGLVSVVIGGFLIYLAAVIRE
jgi:hypothetical protein